jgi:hypothetical protein
LSDNVGDDDYVLLWKDASHDYVIWCLRITMKYNVMLIVPTIITSLTQNKNKIIYCFCHFEFCLQTRFLNLFN